MVPSQPLVSHRALVARGTLPTAPSRAAANRSARGEEVALEYVFDFDQSEQVMYVDSFPFPHRYFLLHFWQKAKDGVMTLLGYNHTGEWRDPNRCHYPSTRRYVPRKWVEQANAPHPHPPREEEPADTTGRSPRREPIARLPSRQVMVELESGVFELPPSLLGLPVHLASLNRSLPKRKVTQRQALRPPLNTPVEKTVIFVAMSAHFQNQSRAENELSGVLKVMRQFPKIHVTIEGNFANTFAPPGTFGSGPKARADQNARFPQPIVTRWPTELESYNSNGALMESRAQTIRQYLIRNGVAASRITARRGQYTVGQRSVTIIFSN